MKLNTKQKIVLWVAGIIIVFMAIIPPNLPESRYLSSNYMFILDAYKIQWSKLFLQWFIVISIATGLIIMSKKVFKIFVLIVLALVLAFFAVIAVDIYLLQRTDTRRVPSFEEIRGAPLSLDEMATKPKDQTTPQKPERPKKPTRAGKR